MIIKDNINGSLKWFGALLAILTGSSLYDNNLSVLIFGLILISLGYFLIKIAFPIQSKISINIYLCVFTIYFLYTFITNSIYVQNPLVDYFYTLDSTKLFSQNDAILKSKLGLKEVLFVNRAYPGFGVLSWSIGLFSNYIDQNTILVQKLHVVFIAAMIPVILFNIAIKYLAVKHSIKVALTFAFFTHLFTYSAFFLRDIHIMAIYTLGFFYLMSSFKTKYLIVLIGLALLVSQFRLQNGIFFILFILAYIYKPFYKLKNPFIKVVFACVLVAVLVASFSLNFFDTSGDVTNKLESYEEYHDSKLQQGAGMAQKLSNLPVFVKPVAFIFLSQFTPFPSYKAVYVANLSINQFWAFPLGFAIFYWIFVLGFFIYGMINSALRSLIVTNLDFSILIALGLIVVGAMASPEYRRLLPAYPIIYMASAIVYFHISSFERTRIIKTICVSYFALILLTLLFSI